MNKELRFLTLLSLGIVLSCLTFSCQQAKEESVLTLEYSSDIDWLKEQGYVLLDETHENYDYVMSLLVDNSNGTNQANLRAQSCQWDGRVAFACDSGSGGTCTVYVNNGGSPFKACLVCVGGNDDGAADCIR